MARLNALLVTLPVLALGACLPAAVVDFHLLTHVDNAQWLPQPKAQVGVSGDHLPRTADDVTGGTFNPDGCFSFNFTNPVGVMPPDYPPGYAEGIHSLTGCVRLEIDLQAGGALEIVSLAFDGYAAPSKPTAHQRLVETGDPAADGSHGALDGMPNNGTYAASAASNWALQASFDWYYDTPFAGAGGIDMTFSDYSWNGFILPVSELTGAGLARRPPGPFQRNGVRLRVVAVGAGRPAAAAGGCVSALCPGRSAPGVDGSDDGHDHRRPRRRGHHRLRRAGAGRRRASGGRRVRMHRKTFPQRGVGRP